MHLHTKMNVFACKCMYLSVIACKCMYLHVLYLFVCIRDRLNVGRLEREPEIKSTRLQVRPLPGQPQTEWSGDSGRLLHVLPVRTSGRLEHVTVKTLKSPPTARLKLSSRLLVTWSEWSGDSGRLLHVPPIRTGGRLEREFKST